MSESRLKRIADWTVRLGLPAAVLATLLAVTFGEQMGIEHELSLLSPMSAARGQTLPIRAMVVTDLGAPGGPRIVSLPVDVTLRALDGTTLVEQRLEASAVGGADGVLQIPLDAPPTVVLRAVAHLSGEGVASVSRTFQLGEAGDPPGGSELVGRIAQATAHFGEGVIELVGGQIPPSPFTSRVVGGACAPESPCDVLVHVGAPAAMVRVAPSPAISVLETPDSPTEGLARIRLVVHGPDAQVVLEATRDGQLVARRPLRLPVALATPGLVIEERLEMPLDVGPTLEVRVVGEPAGMVADVYALEAGSGRWSQTTSFAPSAEPIRLSVPVGRGLARLQVRTDPFSTRRAASRIVLGAGTDLDAAIAQLDPTQWAHAPNPTGPDELRFAWAAAAMEVGHYELPSPVRGFEQDRAVLEARQSTLRITALVVMMLGLLVLAVLLLRRGVGAAREAQRIMEATGDPELASAGHRRRTLLSALAIVATMLLAFVAAGAMIVARAHLLE